MSDMEPPHDPAALEWMVGTWTGAMTQETWVRIEGVLVGVSLGRKGGFEVLDVDAQPGFLRYVARPGGGDPVAFACVRGGPTEAVFTAPEHDFPQRIHYELRKKKLRATIGRLSDEDGLVYTWKPTTAPGFYAAEQADRAFAEAVAARGAEGWVGAFHPEGRIWRPGRQVGVGEMGAVMTPLLEAGDLAWTPVASGLDPWDDDRAWTIGTWTYQGDDGSSQRGWYTTLWLRDPERGWLAWYDVGDTL
ncbi:MAG: hypothetical protein KC621_06175 [Myxococcales bacterium]|nr:hypothetical protein [Myxococcales bacterium]